MNKNRRVKCLCCDKIGRHVGRGLIWSCHRRHRDAGTLEEFPTRRELNMEEYLPLHAQGVSARVAAQRIGVASRTIVRLRASLREQVSS